MNLSRNFLIPAVFLFSVLAPVARAQEGASIRSNVNLVSVSFTARDSRGALVDKLAQDDVEVLEDSARQKISFFAKSSDVPLTLGLIVDASD